LIDKIWIYEWMNITQILHLPINISMHNINAWNTRIMNKTIFAQFPLLSCEMVSLWCNGKHFAPQCGGEGIKCSLLQPIYCSLS
jgi:hypothetical protein